MIEIKEIEMEEYDKLSNDIDNNNYHVMGFIYNSNNCNLIAFPYIQEGIVKYYRIMEN